MRDVHSRMATLYRAWKKPDLAERAAGLAKAPAPAPAAAAAQAKPAS